MPQYSNNDPFWSTPVGRALMLALVVALAAAVGMGMVLALSLKS